MAGPVRVAVAGLGGTARLGAQRGYDQLRGDSDIQPHLKYFRDF